MNSFVILFVFGNHEKFWSFEYSNFKFVSDLVLRISYLVKAGQKNYFFDQPLPLRQRINRILPVLALLITAPYESPFTF